MATAVSSSRGGLKRQERTRLLARSIVEPALKAYLIGYLLDLLPALLKSILRFVTREIKRITALRKRAREERKASKELATSSKSSDHRVETWEDYVKPGLKGVQGVANDAGRAAVTSLGPQGMAAACGAAILVWGLLDSLLARTLLGNASLKSVTTSGRGQGPAAIDRTHRIRVWACFVAAALSSASSLTLLQLATRAADERKAVSGNGGPSSISDRRAAFQGSGGSGRSSSSSSFGNLRKALVSRFSSQQPGRSSIVTPLAPGGHFLAKLTSMSIPGTPSLSGARTPVPPPGSTSPTAHFQGLPDVSALSSGRARQGSSTDSNASLLIPQLQVDGSSLDSPAKTEAVITGSDALGKPSPTIDLTLFALVRGLDTLVRAAPLFIGAGRSVKTPVTAAGNVTHSRASLSDTIGKRRSRLFANSSSIMASLLAALSAQAEGITFVLSCSVIMWSWFYAPERLPPTYVKWITNLASMDERLLLALRSMRTAKPFIWTYQNREVTPAGIDLLGSFAESLGHPYEWGDPTRLPGDRQEAQQLAQQAKEANAKARAEGQEVVSDPYRTGGDPLPGFVLSGAAGARGKGLMGGLPCELVHCGVGGSSCLANAGLRWLRGWKVCMGIYVPVHLLPRLLFNPKQFKTDPITSIRRVLTGSARSASFLATYIASIWFMVCLGRTLLLPRLFPSISHRFWDRGLGPLLGSFTCGLAIFIEEQRKRAEMALYVAPRALYALAEMAKPGWLSQGERGARWAERIAFGLAVGIVITTAKYRSTDLRGVTSVMGWVVKTRAREQRVLAAAKI